MGASLERSEPVRSATRDDLDAVVHLLLRQNREATGLSSMQAEFVRLEWELPSFEVGADNWIAGTSGYAAVSPKGSLTIVAADPATADALLDRAVARGRERGFGKLQLGQIAGDSTHAGLIEGHL